MGSLDHLMPLPVSDESLAHLRALDENEQMIDQIAPERVYQQMFSVLDLNGLGAITKENFGLAVKCMQSSASLDELVDELCPDPSGQLSP